MTETNYIGKTIKVGNSLGITIPVNNLEVLGIKEGDLLAVTLIKQEMNGNGSGVAP